MIKPRMNIIFFNTNITCRKATGLHVPSENEWTTLENYLIANGYNYDGSITGNKIAKSVSSTSGWCCSWNSELGDVAYNQEENNSSGFNIRPVGYREVSHPLGDFFNIGAAVQVWSSSVVNGHQKTISYAYHSFSVNHGSSINQQYGFSVRFVRD